MKLKIFSEKDLHWDLGTFSHHPHPYYRVGLDEMRMDVDPMPAYMPDIEIVSAALDVCEKVFPLLGKHQMCLLAHEPMSRINGLSWSGYVYYENGKSIERKVKLEDGTEETRHGYFTCSVVLSGKRIPIMPAMLRYLVPHEYAHCVVFYLNNQRNELRTSRQQEPTSKLVGEYMKLRGYEAPSSDRWHVSQSEIIANDFRYLVMEAEKDFWPHPVPKPEWNSPIGEWWKKVLDTGSAP